MKEDAFLTRIHNQLNWRWSGLMGVPLRPTTAHTSAHQLMMMRSHEIMYSSLHLSTHIIPHSSVQPTFLPVFHSWALAWPKGNDEANGIPGILKVQESHFRSPEHLRSFVLKGLLHVAANSPAIARFYSTKCCQALLFVERSECGSYAWWE